MQLRPYQQHATDAAIDWMRRSIMPGLLELATGAGKSHVVAAIAGWVYQHSGKRVLCLQPSKELTEQNHGKYLATGNPASIYSASAGSKCMRHPVIYGTPGTVKNNLSRFGDQFGAVIIDEAHGITPTIKLIVETIQQRNPNLRVIGLTATPYRTNTGYIYQYDDQGRRVDESQTRAPYFSNLLYRIQTRELIGMGYLTPAHADPDHAASYEAGALEVNNRGQFDSADVERVFEGRGRLTADIVADIVEHSIGRLGVLIFAATVQHAQEIMESLPPENSMMLGGHINMSKTERQNLVERFRAQGYKYLVNVATMTTGVDFTHVDVIAIMRATESASLLQQMIGRGLRLHPGKTDCLVLDYAENIERHHLHDDLFSPQIRTKGESRGGETIEAECPDCGYINDFILRPDYAEFDRDQYGYVVDLDGKRIETDHGEMPAHFGRRCQGQVPDPAQRGVYIQCLYRWTTKECPECGAGNDIAARYCSECKAEIVDPNEKLARDFMRVKKDPYAISTDPVLAWSATPHTTQSGKDSVRCEYKTEYRSFPVFYNPWSKHPRAIRQWESLSKAVYHGHIAPDAATFLRYLEKGQAPETITYRKQKDSDFFEAIDHNRPADKMPEQKENAA